MSCETLVTGGSGLIGYALKPLLSGAVYLGREDGDLRELSQARALFRQHRPKRVVHLAARVAGVKANAERNADMFTENVQVNTNVLNAAQEAGVEKLVAVLSNCVFQEEPPRPPTEKDVHVGTPYRGHLGYGSAKRMLDLQLRLLREQYGCRYTSITPVTVIGPNDNWDPEESHVAGSLIQKCYRAQRDGTPLEVWGSGRAVRQFVSSHDVARVLIRVLEGYDDPETLIVAPGEGVSVKFLAETVARVMGFKGEIVFDPSKPEGEPRRVLDGSKLAALFPDFKFQTLEESLRSAALWFVANAARVKSGV